MASFIQTAANACANANACDEKRPHYAITRSEATWLVRAYKTALKRGAEIDMEPYRLFRDALENKKPAYLVKYNDSRNAANQGTFYAMATHFFTVLKKLFTQADDTDNERKVKALCKELPTTYGNAYNTITYLNWAVYNWFYRNEKNITEYLSDNGYETNSCAVCDFTGEATFYFSTAYGLEQPVCMFCLPVDETDYEKKDEDYVISEEEVSETESSEGEDDGVSDEDDGVEGAESLDDDSDYVPSEDEESDSDEEEDGVEGAEPLDEEESEDDSDVSSNYTEETDLEENEEEEADAGEAEKTFGCEGCNYEWRNGWRHGWAAAMKTIRNYAALQKNNEPEPPRCATCDNSHADLKKCAGQCGGLVRYCSERCQREDWGQHKQVCRR